MSKKYKLILVQRYDDDFSFVKTVNGKYFTEHTIGDNKYIVSKRIYSVIGDEEEDMQVIYRTIEEDSVYMLYEDWYAYLGTYEDDMHEYFNIAKNAKWYNDKMDKVKDKMQRMINGLRKYRR